MNKFDLLMVIKEKYENGNNIIQYLKDIEQRSYNTIQDILISYDLQAGSYISALLMNPNPVKERYIQSLADLLNRLGPKASILEVGVGEATTLVPLLNLLKWSQTRVLGFDISWSRLKFAKEFALENEVAPISLFQADLFEIPLKDNSVDIVYTSHSIEPNGGREEEALKELYRITKKYLILLEPSFEFADKNGRERMEKHGYIKGLPSIIKDLGLKLIEYRLFGYSANPLNPTCLYIIEKSQNENNALHLVCPITKEKLIKYNDNLMYAEKPGLAYPVIGDIPCLLQENAILAMHLLTDYKYFKNGIGRQRELSFETDQCGSSRKSAAESNRPD